MPLDPRDTAALRDALLLIVAQVLGTALFGTWTGAHATLVFLEACGVISVAIIASPPRQPPGGSAR